MLHKRRRVVGALGALAGLSLARAGFAAGARKRVLFLWLVEIEDAEDRDDFQRLQVMMAGEMRALGFGDDSLEIVWRPVPMKSDWGAVMPPMAADAVKGGFDCIVTQNENVARYLTEATATVPIVAMVRDPVVAGFAKLLSEPGGNVTGLHQGAAQVAVKQIEMLRRLVPASRKVAWISFRPQIAVSLPSFDAAARAAGIPVRQVLIDTSRTSRGTEFPGLASDFASLPREGCFAGHFQGGIEADISAVAALAVKHRVALSFSGGGSDFARPGLLLFYRASTHGFRKRFAAIIAKVLRGARPGTIAFEGPDRYRLTLNLRAAAALGIDIPPDLLVLADDVVR